MQSMSFWVRTPALHNSIFCMCVCQLTTDFRAAAHTLCNVHIKYNFTPPRFPRWLPPPMTTPLISLLLFTQLLVKKRVPLFFNVGDYVIRTVECTRERRTQDSRARFAPASSFVYVRQAAKKQQHRKKSESEMLFHKPACAQCKGVVPIYGGLPRRRSIKAFLPIY